MKTIKEIQDKVEKEIMKPVDFLHRSTTKTGQEAMFFLHLKRNGTAEEYVYIDGQTKKTRIIETGF